MKTHPRKLLVVIAEAALERQLVADVKRLGAHGYTVFDVRGGGARGERGGDWEGGRSVEIKVLCDEGTAQRLVDALIDRYSADYALALWVADVAVARPMKFT